MTAPTETQKSKCGRCELPLHAYREAHDCRTCDPLCPVWGTHGHLWDGDEESSRAAYAREVEAESQRRAEFFSGLGDGEADALARVFSDPTGGGR